MPNIIKIITLSAAAIIVFAAGFVVMSLNNKPGDKGGDILSAAELKGALDKKDDFVLVDVRTPEEYEAGHLDGSMLVPLDTLERNAENVLTDKNKKLYVYCRTGRRSAEAVGILKNKGYTNVYDVSGGITAWQASGYPISKSDGTCINC